MAGTEIVISVSGGLVQDVFGTDADASAIVVDWDADECLFDEPGIVRVRTSRDREQAAYVAIHDVLPLADLAGTDVEAAIEQANAETPVGRRTAS
jgi:hypothetical protein